MKKMKQIVLIAALLTATLSFTACGQKVDKSSEGADNQFRVGMEAMYPPFNWSQVSDANGAVPISGGQEYAGGYDVEIAKRIAEGLGKELVIVKTEWDGLSPSVESDKIDAIIAGMSPTEERKEKIDFTDNYYRSDLVMVVKKGSAYENATSLEDFAGAKITAQQSTFHYTVIDQIPGVVKDSAMSDFSAMRVALDAGMIDGYVSERPEGISVTTANKDFAMVIFEEGKGFQASDDDTAIAVGIKKGNTELATKINEILAGISEEERLEIMDTAIVNQPVTQ